jgi:hypothetical protein
MAASFTARLDFASLKGMPQRREDAGQRRFFDQFEKMRVCRFRATGVIDPARTFAVVPCPDGKERVFNVAHTHLKHGGGWSYFVCPACAKLAVMLYFIDARPLCPRCCTAMNIKHRSKYGFGRAERHTAKDKALDELIAKIESTTPLRLKTPESWRGKAKRVYRSQALAVSHRRRMVALRLNQIADQMLPGDQLTSRKPSAAAKQLVDVKRIWRARTSETLSKALDKAQGVIIRALESDDLETRRNAAKLMLNTKQGRERGLQR